MPDLALIDPALPGGEGRTDWIAALRRNFPALRPMVMARTGDAGP